MCENQDSSELQFVVTVVSSSSGRRVVFREFFKHWQRGCMPCDLARADLSEHCVHGSYGVLFCSFEVQMFLEQNVAIQLLFF